MKLAGARIEDSTYEALQALDGKNSRSVAGEVRFRIDEALKADAALKGRISTVIKKNSTKKGRA